MVLNRLDSSLGINFRSVPQPFKSVDVSSSQVEAARKTRGSVAFRVLLNRFSTFFEGGNIRIKSQDIGSFQIQAVRAPKPQNQKRQWPLWQKILAGTSAAVVIGVLLKKGADFYFWRPEADGYRKEPELCYPDNERFIFSKETGTCNPLDTNCSFNPRDRIITYGTIYDNSKDPARNVYADLTNKLDHELIEKQKRQEQGSRLELKHRVISDAKKFVEKQCTDPLTHEKVDCELYWSKVYPFVQACDAYEALPSIDGKERWMIVKDDDMLALRPDINLHDLIDKIRVNADGTPNDGSIILPTDSHPWVASGYLDLSKRKCDLSFNPNTGFIAGRIDARSCPVYRKWWESRNSIPDRYHSSYCRTLGICPGQDRALHEQQGIGVIADEHPCFKDLITVIKTRDPTSKTRSDIVINSVYGHDKYCFQRCNDNGCQDPRSFPDMTSDNPNVYRSPNEYGSRGDAWAQPSAFPTLGKVALRVNGNCPSTAEEWDALPVEQVRLRMLKELCSESSQAEACREHLLSKSTKIVTAHLWAGLGNQMFQVAAAYAHALDIGGVALFPNHLVDHVKESPVLHKLMRTNIKGNYSGHRSSSL